MTENQSQEKSPHHPDLEKAIRLEREAADFLFQKKISKERIDKGIRR